MPEIADERMHIHCTELTGIAGLIEYSRQVPCSKCDWGHSITPGDQTAALSTRWFVACSPSCCDPSPEKEVWTVSLDPHQTGWETDSGCSGYGLTKALATELAVAANKAWADRQP